MNGRRRLWILGLAAVVSFAFLSAFTITRMARESDDSALAGSGSRLAPKPAANATATPSGRPDTSKPSWARSLLDEDSAKPRYEQTIGAIRLAPGGRPTAGPPECAFETVSEASIAEGQRSALAIEPAFLPPGATIDTAMDVATKCGDLIVNVERTYVIPAEADAEGRVRSGAVNWFDLEHGGYVWIWRTLISGPNYFGTEVPSGQWSEAAIASLPAVIGEPTFDGLGHSTVVVWDANTNILTVVRGLDRRTDELVRVAEGVVR